ncbi:hypothetical protein AHMF7605_25730 [Adhaeribacter arboris]|uniref:Uncharacterized protein n=1 Tax=Adhaeribacter arboris TaxID=2072846 RepID=A0A2T2YMB4_9BACT|nr:hypothetical protein AHMF7605_25730 [Adhaeribacter arboris]
MLQELTLLEELQAWKGIQSAVMIHAKREFAYIIQEEYRFYLSSKKETPAYFNAHVRAHWRITQASGCKTLRKTIVGPERVIAPKTITPCAK